jgi:hypothetical protein
MRNRTALPTKHVWQKEGALKLGKRLIEIADIEALRALS